MICGSGLYAWGQPGASLAPLRGWLTSGQSRFQAAAIPPWQNVSKPAREVIKVESGEEFQEILGFGGAFTDASCYLLNGMGAVPRRQLLEELFGSRGLGLSLGRTCIGASDYSRTAYSFDESLQPDPELQKFSIEHDRAYILPILREALITNPDLFLFSAPWSPPAWMKSSGSLRGGCMRKEYLHSYAQYFLKFLTAYKAEGVNIKAVTTQNEVDTDQDGRMPACLWGQEYEIAFIKEFLGPALQDASLDTKIWLLDHNYNLWGRVLDQLSDPGVFRYVDGVAWHGYVGSPDAMTRVHDAFPAKGAYWTEGGPDISDPDYATDWAKWSGSFAGILKNWARCIVAWNLVLDENGGPNIGPFSCGGLVTLNAASRQITRSGMYWALAHYAKTVQRGARVIGSHGDLPGVDHVAFANPDGSYVLVLTNQGTEREVECHFAGRAIRPTLPGDSVLTLQWS